MEKNLGKQIKIQRIQKDLTQGKLATILNVNSYTISDWECGRTEPDVDSIRKLCIIFEITADELLQIETQEERKQIQINNEYKNFTNNSFNLSNNNNNINF